MLNEYLAEPLGARSHPENLPHPGEARPLPCLGTAGPREEDGLRGMPKPTELGTGAILSGEAGQAGGVWLQAPLSRLRRAGERKGTEFVW